MTYQISIYGKVQGVGFRYFAAKHAQSLEVRGFVKNLPDGSVYAEAEADNDVLENFLNLCRQGPARAVVTEISVIEIPDGGFTEFKIR